MKRASISHEWLYMTRVGIGVAGVLEHKTFARLVVYTGDECTLKPKNIPQIPLNALLTRPCDDMTDRSHIGVYLIPLDTT
jgi:hypothetical protein